MKNNNINKVNKQVKKGKKKECIHIFSKLYNVTVYVGTHMVTCSFDGLLLICVIISSDLTYSYMQL